MGKRPTIQMVADLAGVSRGTVDRVLNNRSYVKEEVRVRVQEAVAELGYLSPHAFHSQEMAGKSCTPVKLGVLLPNWTDFFRPEVLRGIEGAREELSPFGVEIAVEECLTDDPEESIQRLDTLVTRGVRGISLCAVNDFSIEAKVISLVEQDIPVITFNSDLPNSKRISFVGQNYEKSGRIAAELISKCTPRTGRILAMCGNLEFDGHRKRLEGFGARMQELQFPNSQIEVMETYNDYYFTCRRVTEVLERTPNLAAIYMANQSVPGCAQALKAAGKEKEVRLVVHDLSHNTRALLQSGCVDFTISQDFYRQGYLPLKCLWELIHLGKQPEIDQTNTYISVICSQNMD